MSQTQWHDSFISGSEVYARLSLTRPDESYKLNYGTTEMGRDSSREDTISCSKGRTLPQKGHQYILRGVTRREYSDGVTIHTMLLSTTKLFLPFLANRVLNVAVDRTWMGFFARPLRVRHRSQPSPGIIQWEIPICRLHFLPSTYVAH